MAAFDGNATFDGGFFFDQAGSGSSPHMLQNLISKDMTDAQRDAIITDLNAALTKFLPFMHPLTPEDRKSLARVGNTQVGQLELALTFANQNPGALPGDLSVPEFAKDVTLVRQLLLIKAKKDMISEAIDDSLMSALSDGYVAALDIYRVAKAMGRGAEFDAFIDAFGQRFARRPRTTPTPPPPTP